MKFLFVFLFVEIKERSFQIEVIISAIATMIIYGIQLFLSMKNFRESMKNLYREHIENPELVKKLKKHDTVQKSTQYPSYLLVYLLGGFFICFHSILLLIIGMKKVCLYIFSMGAPEDMIGYIISIFVLYLLQIFIIEWLHTIFHCFDKKDEREINLKLTIRDAILLYVKLISCKTSFFSS
jgi:Ca2+/Na+ antiporter